MLQLFQRPVNGAARNSRGLCYRRYTTLSQRTRLQSRSQAKLPLIEVRHQGQQSILKPFCTGHIPRLHYWTNLFKLFCGSSLGLTSKYQLTIALARLRERGTAQRWVRDSLVLPRRRQPLTPRLRRSLGEGRYQLRCPSESKRKTQGWGFQPALPKRAASLSQQPAEPDKRRGYSVLSSHLTAFFCSLKYSGCHMA